MNRQVAPNGIEWTRIKRCVDGQLKELPGYTWNPIGGCFHNCKWQMPDGSIIGCYAKTIAEGLAKSAYPHGFEHHYWRPHLLEEPLLLKEPAGIFVGSMADIFGHWVPDEQVEQVIDVMRKAKQHTFQLLSKYPIRPADFAFPSNVWVGVSLPAGRLMNHDGGKRALEAYLNHMSKIKASVRFMSIEPLWFDVACVFDQWLEKEGRLPFEWVIVGAASNGAKFYQPESEWTEGILNLVDELDIPVFFKGNLDWQPRRADFPLCR